MNQELTSYLQNINFNNQIIYDIGANEGLVLEFLKKNSTNSQLFGVEPHPNNIKILNKKFANVDNIIILEGAVNTFDGNCYIGFEKQQRTNGLQQGHIMSTDTDLQGRKWIEGCMTQSYKLNTLCKNATIIKMDIEGFEHELLYKCLDKLDNVKNWLIEIHSWEDINYHGWTLKKYNKKNDSLNKMIKLFLKNGYSKFILAKKRKKKIIINENTYWTDIPTSNYKQNDKIIYYKVVNLIISK